jgi:hypothetical protein
MGIRGKHNFSAMQRVGRIDDGDQPVATIIRDFAATWVGQ